jgi:hypothetical protein
MHTILNISHKKPPANPIKSTSSQVDLKILVSIQNVSWNLMNYPINDTIKYFFLDYE